MFENKTMVFAAVTGSFYLAVGVLWLLGLWVELTPMMAALMGFVGAMVGLTTLGYTKIHRDAVWIEYEMRYRSQAINRAIEQEERNSIKTRLEKVYFIVDLATNHVKIGRSKNPDQRLRDLQTSSPGRLVLMATIPGDRHLECLFHQHYESCRVNGEWFRLTPQMQAHIEELRKK